jgi:hypothetical protein
MPVEATSNVSNRRFARFDTLDGVFFARRAHAGRAAGRQHELAVLALVKQPNH